MGKSRSYDRDEHDEDEPSRSRYPASSRKITRGGIHSPPNTTLPTVQPDEAAGTPEGDHDEDDDATADAADAKPKVLSVAEILTAAKTKAAEKAVADEEAARFRINETNAIQLRTELEELLAETAKDETEPEAATEPETPAQASLEVPFVRVWPKRDPNFRPDMKPLVAHAKPAKRHKARAS